MDSSTDEAATDEPAAPASPSPQVPAVRLSRRVANPLIGPARKAGRDIRSRRPVRADGWTPERIAIFLNTLADTGIVADAARAAGMSKQSAFALRNSAKGRAFLLAWRAAILLARRSLADEAMSRALNGQVEPIYRDGKVWGKRRRYDNRLMMAMLTRLDRLATAIDRVEGPVRVVAEEFEQFVGIVSRGGEGAAEFVGERLYLNQRFGEEPDLLDRAENFCRYGVGLDSEIDVSDLDPAEQASWTEEQAERASRAGLLDDREEQEPADGRADPREGEPA